MMGICPQHDVIFEDLTVREHLEVFGKLRKIKSDHLEKDIEKITADVGIQAKLKARAKTLSGGQKRRLSLAIALIGDSKLVLLDEPTSGMDPTARRHMWDLLKNYKEGRVVILTTHYMDEADVLGDTIAIMSRGKIECVGDSLTLKREYGVGYLLDVVPKEGTNLAHLENLL